MYNHGAAVRKLAVLTLGKMDAARLSADGHADTLLTCLDDEDDGVRLAAAQVLGTRLDAAALSRCTPGLCARFEHAQAGTREVAVLTAGRLTADELATQVVPAALRLLESPFYGARESALLALAKLPPTTLGEHADAVVARLEDSDGDVRAAARRVLALLPAALLQPHADALCTRLQSHPPDAERTLRAYTVPLTLLATTPPRRRAAASDGG